MSLFDGVTAMRAQGGTPVLIAEREARDTPTMLRVSIADGKKLLDRRGEMREVVTMSKQTERPTTRQEVVRLVVDEGLPQKEAARRLGVSDATVHAHLQRAQNDGEIERVGHGVYARSGQALKAQTQATGLTEEQVRELIDKAVQVRVGELESELIKRLDERVNVLGASVKSMRDQIESVAEEQADLAKRMTGRITDIGQVTELQGGKLGELRTSMTQLSVAVEALENDVQELVQGGGRGAVQGDVAELALRLVAAERGLIA